MAIKKFMVATFDDEDKLLPAVIKVREGGFSIYDVYTPFCVHGLDKALGLKSPYLHVIGFIYGAIGAIFALVLMGWVLLSDWPITYGGKPFWSLPSFIPITFEISVLFAVLSMGCTFSYLCKLGPGVRKHVFNPRATNDRMVMVFDMEREKNTEMSLKKLLMDKGALSVEMQEAEADWYFGLYSEPDIREKLS